MAWNSLEHSLYQELQKVACEKALGEGSRIWLVGLSGGLDSVVLLEVLGALASALKIKLTAAHIHHGPGVEYRDHALKFAQEICAQKEIEFYSARAETPLQGEEELRDFRYQKLREIKEQAQASKIVLAHHQDDLLETRLFRLLRGTGVKGLRGMKLSEGDLVRPLLAFTKEDLQKYAEERGLQWLEDPSNQDLGPARNWLRNQWLADLEKRIPGGKGALGRSLELILEQTEGDQGLPEKLWTDRTSSQGPSEQQYKAIQRPVFLTMTEKQQKQAIASYFVSLGQHKFTQNHVLEVLKHLDKTQNEHRFIVAQCEWIINAEQILAYHLKTPQ